MDIIMGLLAACCWGATDYLVGVNARAEGIKRAVFFGQLIGLILMSAIVGFFFRDSTFAVFSDPSVVVLASTSALLMLTGSLTISKAFSLGHASIVAPVVTSYCVVTTLLSWITGERFSALAMVGIATCIIGVIATSYQKPNGTSKNPHSSKAVYFAILAAIVYGVTFWFQGRYVLPKINSSVMLWFGYLFGLVLSGVLVLQAKLSFKAPKSRSAFFLTAASIFNLLGFSAFALGVSGGSIAVVTVLSTLSGGVAAILGVLLAHEKIGSIQAIGITLALTGAAILHTV